MDYRFVYMTCSSAEEARSIGRAELCEEREVAMIAKTTAARMPALIARVKKLHSYDCPCIIGLPIGEGYQPYLDWLSESCS